MERERVFRGSRMQRGYGLGGFFASLFRRAIPLFKSGGKYIAKKAARTGINTIQDIMGGVDPRSAVKPVSYTHLRAHETPEHLVCRLLLEKKKHKKARTR